MNTDNDKRRIGATTLYRFYGEDGVLLYIGISSNAARRFEQHAGDKTWWREVVGSTMEHFSTRGDALAAEAEAIRNEKPAHNVIHNRRRLNPEQTPQRRGQVWHFRNTDTGLAWDSTLWLEPELSLEPVLDDLFSHPEWNSPDGYLTHYFRCLRNSSPSLIVANAVPIYWALRGDAGIAETAPTPWETHDNFLTYFTRPQNEAGEMCDFARLPVRHQRFPHFATALADLGWRARPFERYFPIVDVMRLPADVLEQITER